MHLHRHYFAYDEKYSVIGYKNFSKSVEHNLVLLSAVRNAEPEIINAD